MCHAIAFWMVAALVYSLALLLVGCGSPASIAGTTPEAPPIDAPQVTPKPTKPAYEPTPTEALIIRLQGELAAAETKRDSEVKAERKAERDAAERPLRSLLTWSQWAGGALALLSVVALGLTFSPWGSWIPGGRTTALVGIATGAGTVLAARSLAAVLDLAWLPWVLLAVGLTAAAAWVVWVVVKETAAHGDRMEPATTPEQIKDAKAATVAAQARAGVKGLINFARGRIGK